MSPASNPISSLSWIRSAPPPEDTQYPALFSRLPLRGFQQGTDRYILGPAALQSSVPIAEGDWVGFANGAEAETAQYRFSGNGRIIPSI